MAADLKIITENLDFWTSALLTKSTVGRGSNGRVEAYGMKKLRELILELAVRGKLVAQDPNDEPASTLLDKIAESQARLTVEGVIKKQTQLAKIEEEGKPFDVPDGWVWSRLGELGYTQTGGTPSKTNPANFGNDIPFIKPGDIYPTYVDYNNEGLSWEGQLELGRTAPANSILMVCIGTIGKCNSIDRTCAFNQQINSITPYIPMTGYLLKAISSNYFQKEAWQQSSSTTIAILNKGKWNDIIVPLPPIKEQQRIVAKVDELMALCDQLEQQQTTGIKAHQTLVETLLGTLTSAVRPEPVEGRGTSQPSTLRLLDKLAAQDERLGGTSSARTEFEENWTRIADNFDTLFTTEQSIDQLKQTILQLAVMGKLVPQDPNDEPASVLLKRLIKQKEQMIEQGALKKDKSVPAPKEGEKLFELPIGWAWSRLPEIGELARGKSKHRPRNDSKLYSNGSIPMIQTGDVSKADPFIVSYTALYNEVGLTQSRLWSKGTMCITIAANIAETGILAFDACFPDSVVGFIPFDEGIDVKYFEYFMRTAKSHLQDFAPSTAQKNINLDILGQLLVPLPPVMELNRIVAKVNELMTLCDALKTRLAAVQATQIHLAEAIVEQAVA